MANPDFTIERLQHQPAISIRDRVSLENAPDFFDRSFTALFAHLGEKGGTLAGPALSRSFARTDHDVDVEVMLPLEGSMEGSEAVMATEVPDAEVAATYHIGSYTRLGETYTALEEFVRASGRELTGVAYEFYVDDPGQVAVDRRRTRIALVLEESGSRG